MCQVFVTLAAILSWLIVGLAFGQEKFMDTPSATSGPTLNLQAYVDEVTRGVGFTTGQERQSVSPQEQEFRQAIERRKSRLLAGRAQGTRPVMLSEADIDRAKRNCRTTAWGQAWLAETLAVADHVVNAPEGYVEAMISELTPTNVIGFTCPACVGARSLEGMGSAMVKWDYRDPEVIRCGICGQTFPDASFPETGKLACPRQGQEFTFYRNDAERKNPEDRSGALAWKWVRRPMHISFAGMVRYYKNIYMASAAKKLALTHRLTGDVRYARKSAEILLRLAHCYRHWLYHDYWDTFADCDPLYAAWYDRDLRLEWKRHPCGSAYQHDSPERAAMLQSYWGAGRIAESTDNIGLLTSLCLAYDLIAEAHEVGGEPVLSPEARQTIERDLILEYLLGSELYVATNPRPERWGGPVAGSPIKPDVDRPGPVVLTHNKAPRIYEAMAAVGVCLGLPEFADKGLRGYEIVRDASFLSDGFSHESPAYTNMFLATMLEVPEILHGYRWPDGFAGRSGAVDLFASDGQLRGMMRAALEQLRPDGRYLPLSDTIVTDGPTLPVLEIGLKRYPDLFAGRMPALYRGRPPTDYAVFHLEVEQLERDMGLALPEIFFPGWMTAILRHGAGPEATVLAMPLNPPGIHRHGDNLTLYYSDRGQPVLGELGYVGDSALIGWSHSTLSHNLVVVDDQEQLFGGPHPRQPSLRLMATSPRVSVVEAQAKAYAQCSEYRRLAVLCKGPSAETFAVDIFRVRGGSKHAYRLLSELAASDAPQGALEFAGLAMPAAPPLPDFGGSIQPGHVFGLRDPLEAASVPAAWQATWKQADRAYRLHMLSPAGAVIAAHGPGQESRTQVGRRVRYLDVINQGPDLASTFVAIHEPSSADGTMPIARTERLDVPPAAGPQAVAIRIESRWGTYLVLSEFAAEAPVAGVRFQGTLGIFGQTPQGQRWLLACGATTLKSDRFGFENAPAAWSGRIVQLDEQSLTVDTPRPVNWPAPVAGVSPYVLTGDGKIFTGFAVQATEPRLIKVARFPLSKASRFELPAVQMLEE